jgi:hypothetical protein
LVVEAVEHLVVQALLEDLAAEVVVIQEYHQAVQELQVKETQAVVLVEHHVLQQAAAVELVK